MAAMPHCEATRWNPLFSDIIPKGSSKQVGVDKMLDYFGISLEGLSLVPRFGKHAPPLVHTLIANIYLLILPVMNPIIYSVKTKQIRKAMVKIFLSKLI